MSFYFRPFPKVSYDIKKNNLPILLTNITARYKIRDILKSRTSIYFSYTVKDGDRPDVLAYKYYGDETLDWLIYLVNDIIDPYYDWPLSDDAFNKYMTTLYGSPNTARATTYEYRKILNSQSTLIDGTVVPERFVVVDQNTYNGLSTSDRKEIDAYQYYEEQNDKKRDIKILSSDFVGQIKSEVEVIFSENYN